MPIDFVIVLGLYLAALVWTCLRSSARIHALADFTTGGHRMGLGIGLATSAAMWISMAVLIGLPGYFYRIGVPAMIVVAAWFVVMAIAPLLADRARRPAPPARTLPEFIRMRFEPGARISVLQILAAVLLLVAYLLVCHLLMASAGSFIHVLTGLPYETAVSLYLLLLLLTCSSGLWSVARADVLHVTLMVLAVLVGTAVVMVANGGIGAILANAATTTAPVNAGGTALAPGVLLSPVGGFGVPAMVTIFVSTLLGLAASPFGFSRYLAPKNRKTGVLQMMWTLIAVMPVFLCLLVIGLGLKMLEPSLPAGKTTGEVFPLIFQARASSLGSAIMLAGALAISVSAASSMLFNGGVALYHDIYRPLRPGRQVDDRVATWQLRGLLLALGLLTLVSVIVRPPWLANGVGYVYGAVGAAFLWTIWLGLFWRRMNRAGAYAGLVIGPPAAVLARSFGLSSAFMVAVAVSLLATLLAVFATRPGKAAAGDDSAA